MKVSEYLPPTQILLDVDVADKEELLRFVADAFVGSGVIADGDALYRGMKSREETMSTGVGDGIGIPHTTSGEAKNAAVFLIRLRQPIDFQALDGNQVDIVIALVIPEKETTLHIRLLARVSRLCRNRAFMNLVRQARSADALYREVEKLEEDLLIQSRPL